MKRELLDFYVNAKEFLELLETDETREKLRECIFRVFSEHTVNYISGLQWSLW